MSYNIFPYRCFWIRKFGIRFELTNWPISFSERYGYGDKKQYKLLFGYRFIIEKESRK